MGHLRAAGGSQTGRDQGAPAAAGRMASSLFRGAGRPRGRHRRGDHAHHDCQPGRDGPDHNGAGRLLLQGERPGRQGGEAACHLRQPGLPRAEDSVDQHPDVRRAPGRPDGRGGRTVASISRRDCFREPAAEQVDRQRPDLRPKTTQEAGGPPLPRQDPRIRAGDGGAVRPEPRGRGVRDRDGSGRRRGFQLRRGRPGSDHLQPAGQRGEVRI